jgi:GTP cyclohydrolase I
VNIENVAEKVKTILEEIGEDPNREGLIKTPERVAKAYEFLTKGYYQNVDEVINGAIFEEKYDEMVIVKDIDFYSMCEHHMLPFYGKIHVAYIPNGKIVGLSKIPRLVDMFARRLQVQERLTQQIADVLEEKLQPKGVAVVAEGYHMCMMMRGVQKQNSITTTSAVHGAFRAEKTRLEFLNLISQSRL